MVVPFPCICYFVQKLQARQATLKGSTLPERQKEKWSKAIIADMMSSEGSDGDDDDSIIIKPLPWRSSMDLTHSVCTSLYACMVCHYVILLL